MKNAGIYIRVSTQEQAREGYSILAQEEKLKAYAVARDFNVKKTYSDPGYSGAKLDRPALQEMINDVEKHEIDTIIVYKLDRLSRSQQHTMYLIQDVLIPNNVDFVSLQESIDTSTSFGIAMIGILAVFAELERSTITERMGMGRIERAKDGYYHGGGNFSPLGYDYVGGELIVNEYEAAIVREMFELYASGHSMNSVGLRMQEKYPERIRSYTIVKDALKKVLYIGKVQFANEIYDGRHQAIVDDDLFNRVQMIRKERSVGSSGTNKRKGLLIGKLYCAHCGARFKREVSGSKKYRYINYQCYSKSRSSKDRSMVKDPDCNNRIWKEEELDNKILNYLMNLNFTDIKNRPVIKNEINYDAEIKNVTNQLDRLIELYTMDKIDINTFDKKSDALVKKRDILMTKKKIQDNTVANKKELVKSLKDFNWKKATKADQIKLIDLLVSRVEVDNDNVSIHLNF